MAVFISVTNPLLRIQDGDLEIVVEIDAGAQVLLNDLPAHLTSLLPGDEIQLIGSPDCPAIRVQAKRN